MSFVNEQYEDTWWRLLEEESSNKTITVGNSTDDDGGEAKAHESMILRNTFSTYGSVLLVASIVLCWARLRFPKVFNVKGSYNKKGSELATNQYGFLSWIWQLFMIPDERILDECGMDALCFVRLCNMGLKLSVVGMVCSIFLMPLYATAAFSEETAHVTDRIVMLTTGHVGPGSPRLIGTAIAAWVIFGFAMYAILKEMEWFIAMRHRFLMKPMARNYAVYLRNIPPGYETNRGIQAFFEKCLGVNLLESHICMKTTNLQMEVAKREDIIKKLEHAVAEEEVLGINPTHKLERAVVPGVSVPGIIGGGDEVDSISYYVSELKKHNQDISGRIDRLREEADQTVIINSSSERDDYMEDSTDEETGFLSFVKSNAVNVVSGVKDNTTAITSGATGLVAKAAKEAVNLVVKDEDGEIFNAGFVVFKKLTTVQTALQMIHHEKPFQMECLEAPDHDDIEWANVGRKHKDLQMGMLISVAATTVICLLWTIPVSFVASLSSVEALRQELSLLNDMLDSAPYLVSIFEVLAPQLLVALNALLPVILTFITKFEGSISGAGVEASLFVKLAAFTIIQTFFVSAISSGILEEIGRMIEQPKAIVDLLATSLPAQSTFFFQMAVVMTTTTVVIEGLRVVPIALATVRRFAGPRLTEKERETTFMGLRPLSDPDDFAHADFLSNAVLLFMIYLVYSVIAPLVSFIIALCFVVMGALFRHHFVYIYSPKPDSGGFLWMNFTRILTSCLLIAEITVTGLLGLKKAAIATTMMLPLCICTVLFSYYIRQMHFRVAEHLPTRLCLKQDRNNSDLDYSFVHDAYLQPELKERDAFPELSPSRLRALGLVAGEEEQEMEHDAATVCRVTRLEVPEDVLRSVEDADDEKLEENIGDI